MFTHYKKFILFVCVIVVLDQAIGLAMQHLFSKVSSGDMCGGMINNALKQDADIIILGSSRARYHVIPSVIKTESAPRVYNAGAGGYDFLYSIMLMDLWQKQHKAPKMILLHLDPHSLAHSSSELERIHIFSPFYDKSDLVREILQSRNRFEQVKYLSSSYRFNGKVVPLVKNYLQSSDLGDGYIALDGTLPEQDVESPNSSRQSGKSAEKEESAGNLFDEKKLLYLNNLIAYCQSNHTQLVLFHSPIYGKTINDFELWKKQLATLKLEERGVVFIDFAEDAPELSHNRALFKDYVHLNATGAQLMSETLVKEIRPYLSKNNEFEGTQKHMLSKR